MFEYAKTAKPRGLKVIIAGAGGAAHLPGMVASLTTLPCIGVPIKTDALGGVDSPPLHRANAEGNPGRDCRHRGRGKTPVCSRRGFCPTFDENLEKKLENYSRIMSGQN